MPCSAVARDSRRHSFSSHFVSHMLRRTMRHCDVHCAAQPLCAMPYASYDVCLSLNELDWSLTGIGESCASIGRRTLLSDSRASLKSRTYYVHTYIRMALAQSHDKRLKRATENEENNPPRGCHQDHSPTRLRFLQRVEGRAMLQNFIAVSI